MFVVNMTQFLVIGNNQSVFSTIRTIKVYNLIVTTIWSNIRDFSAVIAFNLYLVRHILLIWVYSAKLQRKSVSLHCLSRQSLKNKESASFLWNRQIKQRIHGVRSSSLEYTWTACPCVYSGVWRYLQEAWVAVHFLFNKHC